MLCLYHFVCVMHVSLFLVLFFFFKQKTAYEMRISDWSSDVCSSDLPPPGPGTSANLRPFVAVFREFGPQVRDGSCNLRPFVAVYRRFGPQVDRKSVV